MSAFRAVSSERNASGMAALATTSTGSMPSAVSPRELTVGGPQRCRPKPHLGQLGRHRYLGASPEPTIEGNLIGTDVNGSPRSSRRRIHSTPSAYSAISVMAAPGATCIRDNGVVRPDLIGNGSPSTFETEFGAGQLRRHRRPGNGGAVGDYGEFTRYHGRHRRRHGAGRRQRHRVQLGNGASDDSQRRKTSSGATRSIRTDAGDVYTALGHRSTTTRSSAGNGPPPNDPLDADTGVNKLQNFPILFPSVSAAGEARRITEASTATRSTTFDLDFFSNPACSNFPREFLEGQTYLGSSEVTTDGSGNASIECVPVVTEVGARHLDGHRPRREHLRVLAADDLLDSHRGRDPAGGPGSRCRAQLPSRRTVTVGGTRPPASSWTTTHFTPRRRLHARHSPRRHAHNIATPPGHSSTAGSRISWTFPTAHQFFASSTGWFATRSRRASEAAIRCERPRDTASRWQCFF